MPSKIGWTGETWNPVSGCTKTSAGCRNCYAEKRAKRLQVMGTPGYRDGFKVTLHPDRLYVPCRWRKPRLVFVCSMGDLFHRSVPPVYIKQVFKVMADCSQHTFQVLTKRPARMMQFAEHNWPGNVWLGTSVENATAAVDRLFYMYCGDLLTIHRRFISFEPVLGAVDWTEWRYCFNWLIIGCESGPGRRPFKNEWALSAIKECRDRGVPVFVKQIIVDGKVSHDPSEWPKELQVQEYPEAMMRVLGAGR